MRAISLAVAVAVATLGLGARAQEISQERPQFRATVAATVNGRAIHIEDVRAHAVARGWLQETEDLGANSDAFYLALEELVEVRLFALEAEARGLDRENSVRRQLQNARERVLATAEARGLDREADVRRQLENAREQVLANAIYEEIDRRSADPEAIEQLYRENTNSLSQGEEIHLRHIQFESQEAADAAKRRLDQGERFEALAFELSTERDTAADGGDLGFAALSDVAPVVREASENASVGQIFGPLQLPTGWNLFRLEDRRAIGLPSLEALRPQIIQWLRYRETVQLNERLAHDARIERLREPSEAGVDERDGAPADAFPFPGTPSQSGGATQP